jgi:hypothetical protein
VYLGCTQFDVQLLSSSSLDTVFGLAGLELRLEWEPVLSRLLIVASLFSVQLVGTRLSCDLISTIICAEKDACSICVRISKRRIYVDTSALERSVPFCEIACSKERERNEQTK